MPLIGYLVSNERMAAAADSSLSLSFIGPDHPKERLHHSGLFTSFVCLSKPTVIRRHCRVAKKVFKGSIQ